MRAFLPALLMSLALTPASAAEEGSVLVTTMAPRQGSLPDIITAYGTAGPALNGSMTISLQSQGRVLQFDVTPGEAVKAGQPLLEFGVSEFGARQRPPSGNGAANGEGRTRPHRPACPAAARHQGPADPGR